MNKVKAIFNSGDNEASSTTSSRTTDGLGTANSRGVGHHTSSTGTTGTGGAVREAANEVSGTHGTHSTHGSRGTEGSYGNEGSYGTHSSTGGSSVAAKPSLPGHKHNIERNADLDSATGEKTHDHKHLAAVTKEHIHEHETEEVIREREHDRHIHHVQHHVQPVLDTQHAERQHERNIVPTTEIRESHVNTAEDKELFRNLAVHKDEQHHHGKERTIVDKGEVVNEKLHHHVHHVVQPVIERDSHLHKTIHTTIPVHAVTHEAPIVHQSSTHEPLQMKDFLSQGGDLKSKLTHQDAGVLAEGECAREVDGPLEKLADKLHLGSHSGSHSHGTTGTTGTTGTGVGSHGTTGQHADSVTGSRSNAASAVGPQGDSAGVHRV